MLRPGAENSYTVVGIGYDSEGKMAMMDAAGHDYQAEPKHHSRQDAERERDRLLAQWQQGGLYRPAFWSTSLRLEIWTLGQWADAIDNGTYATF
jgi:hypothetical protein